MSNPISAWIAKYYMAEKDLKLKKPQAPSNIVLPGIKDPLIEACKNAKEGLKILLRKDGSQMRASSGFVFEWETLAEDVHELAVEKGWWDNPVRNKGEAIALMHAELSECLEALREESKPSEKIPEFNCVEEELADVVIRIMDFARGFDYDVAGAIEAKFMHNTGRPYKHGNKKF